MADQKPSPEKREAECNAPKTIEWAYDFAQELIAFSKKASQNQLELIEGDSDWLIMLHKMRLYYDSIKDS
jgi:hypothetical protein